MDLLKFGVRFEQPWSKFHHETVAQAAQTTATMKTFRFLGGRFNCKGVGLNGYFRVPYAVGSHTLPYYPRRLPFNYAHSVRSTEAPEGVYRGGAAREPIIMRPDRDWCPSCSGRVNIEGLGNPKPYKP